MKNKNLFLFLLICLGALTLAYQLDFKQKISLEVLDLFPHTKERSWIDLYRKIGDSGAILVAQNPHQSKQEFEAFLAQVQLLPNVQSIITADSTRLKLEHFIWRHYFFLGHLDRSKKTVSEIKDQLLQNQISIHPIDPLGIIKFPNLDSSMLLHNQPYAIIKINDTNASSVHQLYEAFVSLAQRFKIKHYFSPLFVDVQNPQLILKEVNTLTLVALAFFVILYFLILRIPLLTFNSIITILMSNIIAIFSLFFIYSKVSIMSLSFGIGISNICIDYMMHHHFLGFYKHKKITFNTSVFYGFLTTIIGFMICLFVPFPLLNQLALYAMINLTIAYICFSFFYQTIPFAPPKFFSIISKLHHPILPSWLILLISLSAGIYGIQSVQQDLDLSKLDYQNQEFEQRKRFFAPLISQNVFLIQAKSIDSLIERAKKIAQIDPNSVGPLGIFLTQNEVKSREQYYKSLSFVRQKDRFRKALHQVQIDDPQLKQKLKESYSILSTPPQFTLQVLKDLGITILKEGEYFYFQGHTQDLSSISHFDWILTQQPQELMQQITNSVFFPMVSILILAFIAIVLLLLILSGKRFLDSLTFIFFPISCIILYLSLTTPLNIMHLFALLLIVVVGIDYGIYHIKEQHSTGAKHAMIFSTLTTLCSFGFFILSKTKALNSFGSVIVIGMTCLLIIVFFQKDLTKQ